MHRSTAYAETNKFSQLRLRMLRDTRYCTPRRRSVVGHAFLRDDVGAQLRPATRHKARSRRARMHPCHSSMKPAHGVLERTVTRCLRVHNFVARSEDRLGIWFGLSAGGRGVAVRRSMGQQEFAGESPYQFLRTLI